MVELRCCYHSKNDDVLIQLPLYCCFRGIQNSYVCRYQKIFYYFIAITEEQEMLKNYKLMITNVYYQSLSLHRKLLIIDKFG